MRRINKNQSWFFERVKKIDTSSARLNKKKSEHKYTKKEKVHKYTRKGTQEVHKIKMKRE